MQFSNHFVGVLIFAVGIDNSSLANTVEIRERHIKLDIHLLDNALTQTIFRNHRNAVIKSFARRTVYNLFAFHVDFSAISRCNTINTLHDFCSACSNQSSKAKNLPRTHLKIDVFKHALLIKMFNIKQNFAFWDIFLRIQVFNLSSGDAVNQIVHSNVFDNVLTNHMAITEDCHTIRKIEDFLKFVTNKQYRNAVGCQFADDFIKNLYLFI